MTSSLANQIAAWCDTQDREHASTTCPGGPDCIHAAVTTIRDLLRLANSMRRDVEDNASLYGAVAADQVLTTIAGPLGIKETNHG